MKEIRVFTKNDVYQTLETLKTNRNKRYRQNCFLVEGVRSLKEARQNGWKFVSLIYDRDHLSSWAQEMIREVKTEVNYVFTPQLMQCLSGKEDTSELMAVIGMREDTPEKLSFRQDPFIVLFDRPSNKGNLGTMIRSCDALGADALVLTGHAVDLYDPDVVVSAMGSFFNLPVIRLEDNEKLYAWVEELRSRYPSFRVVGTTAHKEYPIDKAELSGPLMLMIGNETMGLNKAFKEYCDTLVTIPMAESSYASSFNVSCAASIMMYEVTRQRRLKADL